ncbi:hypothetical protein SSPS47_11675 [Streptomyces sp. S4.7]|uniref:hypothetical protein n=1 Tax=unclassified Streptomyces TaxID=2593676 RepID=UPI0011CB5957|nr:MULTISPECIES: hypothetical protein [unclassified Streptomyces]QHY95778.1 hypothetical protein SSPS47_11675 [Streptomyces sp. S4.7]TXL88866.1 hypothetical protein EW053_17250 [Streptomyces sp. IB2014 016-6]
MPFSDVHLHLHAIRATELRAEAAAHRHRAVRPDSRARLGWLLVELGLRLVNRPPRPRVHPV